MLEKLKNAFKAPVSEPFIITTPDGRKYKIGSVWKNPHTDKHISDINPLMVFKAYHNSEYKDIEFWYSYLLEAIEESILRKHPEWITNEAWRAVAFFLRVKLIQHIQIEKYGNTDWDSTTSFMPPVVDEEISNLFDPSKYRLEARRKSDRNIEWGFRSKDDLNRITDIIFGVDWIAS